MGWGLLLLAQISNLFYLASAPCLWAVGKTGFVRQGGDHCLLWKPGLCSALMPPGPGQQLATVPGRPLVSQPPLALFTRALPGQEPSGKGG